MILRALRAQSRSFAADVVLLWSAVAAFVMSLSLATSVPPEFAAAPADVREALMAPFGAVLATYGAVCRGCLRFPSVTRLTAEMVSSRSV